MDDPSKVNQWINHLNKREQAIFKKGYLACLHKLLEQLSDSKFKISNKILDCESEQQKEMLQSRLYILDLYEDHYAKIVQQFEETEIKSV